MRLYSMNRQKARRQAEPYFDRREKSKEYDRKYSKARYERIKSDPEAYQARLAYFRDYYRRKVSKKTASQENGN